MHILTADDIELITDPDHELLHTPTKWVEDVAEVRHYIPAMIAYIRRHGGAGLSANQIGQPHSVFVTNIKGDWPRVFINPTLEAFVGEPKMKREGCLSNPNVTYKRKRHSRVTVSALGLDGDRFRLDTGRGYYITSTQMGRLMAQCIQHEMEHLDGIDVRTGEVVL